MIGQEVHEERNELQFIDRGGIRSALTQQPRSERLNLIDDRISLDEPLIQLWLAKERLLQRVHGVMVRDAEMHRRLRK